jgi:Zn-dependent peptidase ImmA (M78 family)
MNLTDPIKLAAKMQIDIYETDFTDEDGTNVSGIAAIEGRKPVIYVNLKDPREKQRFIIAHEIYHIYAGDIGNKENRELIDDEKRLRSMMWNKEERQANTFAMQFLMPRRSIKHAIKKGIGTSVEELAELFQVPENVMIYKLLALRSRSKFEYLYNLNNAVDVFLALRHE